MPQRVINAWMIVVAIAGLVLVAALVLFGADLRRASRTGPQWKRRLLTAALALLSAVGMGVAGRQLTAAEKLPGAAAARLGAAKGALAQSPQWNRLAATWKEADDVASGRKGPYPFDATGKKALLAALADRTKDVDALAANDLLAAPEADLLKKDLAYLTAGVQRKRPVEMRMATCYKPMHPITSPYYGIRRLEDRLAALAKLAESKTLHPQVVRKVLATVDADIKAIETSKRPADRQKAEKTFRTAKALAAKIRARLGGSAGAAHLEATAQWKTIVGAWQMAKPLADSHRSTTAQRKQADQKLKAAKSATGELAKTGAISAAAAALLTAEADTIRTEIYREPPTDSRVKCYDMAYIPPVAASFTRLSKRLPLLQKLAAGGKVSPAVVAKVLPTVRADLATLADPKQTGKLEAQRKSRLARMTDDVNAAIEKIEKLLESGK